VFCQINKEEKVYISNIYIYIYIYIYMPRKRGKKIEHVMMLMLNCHATPMLWVEKLKVDASQNEQPICFQTSP